MFSLSPLSPTIRRSMKRLHGFTLVELLVVIAIIGVLVGLLLPAIQAARESGRRSACSNNMKQLALGLLNYHEASRQFPGHLSVTMSASSWRAGVGWHCLVLPFIEQVELFSSVKPDEASYEAGQNSNRVLGQNRVSAFLCPSQPKVRSDSTIDNITNFNGTGVTGNAFTTHYVGNGGPLTPSPSPYARIHLPAAVGDDAPYSCDGVLPFVPSTTSSNPTVARGVKISQITDGTSKTFMLLELSWNGNNFYRSWVRGADWDGAANSVRNVRYPIKSRIYFPSDFNNVSMGSEHPGVCGVTFADGHVEFLGESTDWGSILVPLSSRAGGETPATQ